MRKVTKKILNKIGEIVYRQAEKEVNSLCPFYHYQPPIPETVNALRKTEKR